MFSCGNFETLLIKDEKSKVQDLKKDLVNFHKENYVGSAMTFCIQGYDTLLNMEELVVKHLDVVPVGDKCLRKEMAIPSNHRDPYNTSEFKKMYIMEGNTLQMLIAWALPPEVGQDFKNNPFEFWGSLLEDEGTHGLPYLLRQRGLITDFSASIPDIDYWRNEYCTMFEVRLVLRKNVVLNCDGHKKEGNLFINLENIMETVYEYLGKLRQTSLKQRKAAWEEFSKTKNEYFDYSIPVEGVNYTTKCAVALQTLPDEAILTSERVVTEYNDQVMRGYLEQLTPSNMNVITILPREVVNTYAAELKKCDAAVEPYTKRKFWSKLIEVERLNKLLKNKATTPLLIPTNNPISSESQTQFACVHKIPPKLIALNAKCQVTHVGNFGDDWFIGNVNIHTFSSASVFRLNHTNLCKLYLLQSYLQQVVLPDASEIGRAGLQVSIDLVYDSLRIQLSGFPNNLPLALKKIMLHIFPNEESISQVAFDAAKESLLYGVSHSLGQGAFLINNLLDEAVTCDSPSFRNAINTICNVDFQTFVTFTRTFANSTFVWASLEGNMSAKNCEDIAIILSTLNYYPVISGWKNSTLLVKPERFALPLEKRCIRVKSEFRKEKNSVVRNCYQFATNLHQTHASVIVNFLGMCMRAPYFQILRTEEQVGYKLHILHFQNYLPYPCIFADAVFPAHKTTLCEVDAKIDNFFVKFWERNLKNMNDAEFRELKHLWGIPDDLNLQDVKTFYEHAFIQNGPTGKGIKVHVSKISVQVLGMDRENCEGFIKCKESNWAKPMKEKDQPISFCTDADDLCEGVHYFVRDIQWFRDGKFQ
ncbi:putative zinc protease mug138 [Folsomia candida]|nr:putative zinc protease mug138 [Folsomia candida]